MIYLKISDLKSSQPFSLITILNFGLKDHSSESAILNCLKSALQGG